MSTQSMISNIMTPANAGNICKQIACSKFMPAALRGDYGSALIIMEMSQRLGVSLLTIANNVYEVHGNLGFSGKFAVAMLNRCPKYTRIKYEYLNGTDHKSGVRVIGYRADAPDDPDIGPAVTPEMVRAEGWNKNSKWSTMPDLMYRYRAAAFFLRTYAPDALMGMQTREELDDIAISQETATPAEPRKTNGEVINETTEPEGQQYTLADLAEEAAQISQSYTESKQQTNEQ